LIESRDDRFEELALRYWDNVLSDPQAVEFEDRLRRDLDARDRFRSLSLQAVTAADRAAVGRMDQASPDSPPTTTGTWTRRKVLRVFSGGLAAGVFAGLLGRDFLDLRSQSVRIAELSGAVRVMTENGEQAARKGGEVPAGGTISTYGFDSSVQLTCPDGTGVALAGDSSITLEHAKRLVLRRGNAVADVPAQDDPRAPLVLATAALSVTSPNGASLAIGQLLSGTEISVREGRVNVSAPTGEPMMVVREGEMLTVHNDGDSKKQALPPTPNNFAWDLTRPLPESWHIGTLGETANGRPVVRPAVYPDPYHKYTPMYQIRSDKQWMRGFFRLVPESRITVNYRLARIPRRGVRSQLVVCVRSTKLPNSATGVLECNDAFAGARRGEWQTLEIRAKDMLDNVHTPAFDAPWIGFLVIFNTYEDDLGLEISDFRVTGPGRSSAGA
jgi:hypothetical protein